MATLSITKNFVTSGKEQAVAALQDILAMEKRLPNGFDMKKEPEEAGAERRKLC